MLKQGDLIIAEKGRDSESWWVMLRDEVPEDHRHSDRNARCVLNPPGSFSRNPFTSWDSQTVVEQSAQVISEKEVPDEMWATIATYRLLTGE